MAWYGWEAAERGRWGVHPWPTEAPSAPRCMQLQPQLKAPRRWQKGQKILKTQFRQYVFSLE